MSIPLENLNFFFGVEKGDWALEELAAPLLLASTADSDEVPTSGVDLVRLLERRRDVPEETSSSGRDERSWRAR